MRRLVAPHPVERGVLGILNVSSSLPVALPGNETTTRKLTIAAVGILAASFIPFTLFPPLHHATNSALSDDILFASAAAYLAAAFLLTNRTVISRSPALCIVEGSFIFAAILMSADALLPKPVASWLSIFWHAGLAMGLLMFAAADWSWASAQTSARRAGYYSDNRLRFVQLEPQRAALWIGLCALAALVAAMITIAASSFAVCCHGTKQSLYLDGIVSTLLIAGLVLLLLRPRARRSRRIVTAALIFASLIIVPLFLFSLPPIVGGGYAPLLVPALFAANLFISIGAVLSLLLIVGHRSMFRWALVASGVASVLDNLAIMVLPVAQGMHPIATGYTLAAAFIPIAILLHDARANLTAVEQEARQLMELSLVDETSGIANYRALMTHLERAITIADATGTAFAIVLLDIKGVKKSNRSAARHAGDELVRLAGRVLPEVFWPLGLAGRIQGDAFAVLLPPGTPASEELLRKRVAMAVSKESWRISPLELRFYVNVFDYNPQSPRSARQFLSECKQEATRLKVTTPPTADATGHRDSQLL